MASLQNVDCDNTRGVNSQSTVPLKNSTAYQPSVNIGRIRN